MGIYYTSSMSLFNNKKKVYLAKNISYNILFNFMNKILGYCRTNHMAIS